MEISNIGNSAAVAAAVAAAILASVAVVVVGWVGGGAYGAFPGLITSRIRAIVWVDAVALFNLLGVRI